MAGSKGEAAAPKRGAKGGQQQRRETPPPAEVQIGGVQQQQTAEVEVPVPTVDPLAVLAARVAGARGEAAAIEAIDRASLDDLRAVLPRLSEAEGRGQVDAEIKRRLRVVAAEAGVAAEAERNEGLVSVGKRHLPCPMAEDRLTDIRAQFSKASWELTKAKEKAAARAADDKAQIKTMEEDLRWLAERAGTGLEDQEVQTEERIEVDEKGAKIVGCYRLDTGERYSTRYASAADIDAAAQVRLRWGRP